MPSPLFNAFGNNNPMNNMQGLVKQFNQFQKSFRGNPQQQVQNLLNSGRMTQAQFNQYKQMAEQFRRMI